MSAAARTLGELAALVGGEVRGDASLRIHGVASLDAAGPDQIAFYAHARYRSALAATRAGAVILAPADAALADGRPLLQVRDPQLAFARISAALNPADHASPGIDPRAVVHPSAHVDPSAAVLPLCFVGRGARVGPRTVLHSGAVVGEGATVGADCVLYPNAVVRERCVLGDRVTLQPGAVIGSDGFGYAYDAARSEHVKVPQLGIARVEDDVEIGACACVDRATAGETVIGRGTKIDNLVQVGHNVTVGPNSILCGQAGVSGSSRLGAGVVLAGQVGIAGHLSVGDGAKLAGKSGVIGDVPAGATWAGVPAGPHFGWLRQMAALRRLPELEKAVEALRQAVGGAAKPASRQSRARSHGRRRGTRRPR